MSESIQEQVSDTLNSPIISAPLWKRRLYGAFMVIMTFLDFMFVIVVRPEWQSGGLDDYVGLFLSSEASIFFFPLILYSIACFLLLMENHEQYAGKFFIRIGIYTGVFLALQYSLLVTLVVNETSLFSIALLLLLYASPLLVRKSYKWLSAKLSQVLIGYLVIGLGLISLLVLIFVQGEFFFFFGLALVGFAAPFWSFLISGQTALWLLKNYEAKLTIFRGLGILAWLAAYIGALRFDILKMYELYAALPPQPPDCYIATAAANGHPGFVKSKLVHLKNGKSMQVNSQLQHFKFVEIALMAASPKLHELIRKIYDVAGKKLAGYIRNPLLADVAFLLLVPVEWVSFHTLKIFVSEIELISKKIYYS